jgi:phospholipid transport system substrate-binding protein
MPGPDKGENEAMMSGPRSALFAAAAFVLGMLVPVGAIAQDTGAAAPTAQVERQLPARGAVDFVRDLGNQAVAIVTAQPPATADKQHERLKVLINAGFDLEQIGRFVLGRHWRDATDAQRAEFQELFAPHLLNSHARQLSTYRATTFTILSNRLAGERDVMVETEISSANGPINAAWRVREVDGQHKIIDVVIDGISMALAQRQEFGALANRVGIEGLLAQLQANAAKQQARLEDGEAMRNSSAKTWMLFSVVGSSGSPWEVSLGRR